MQTPTTGLLVKFKSRLSREEVEKVVEERIQDFKALAGLRQKYYLHDPSTGEFAGFYLWDSPEALAAFNTSDLRASIAEVYQFDGAPRIEVYQVVRSLHE